VDINDESFSQILNGKTETLPEDTNAASSLTVTDIKVEKMKEPEARSAEDASTRISTKKSNMT